jgi:trehalose 6-phosphate phosphatase
VDLSGLVEAARAHLPGLLVATDFDGTLAPIGADPQQSRPADGAVAALSHLAALGAHIGVITGRDAETVVHLGGLGAIPGLVVEGLYGAERWRAGSLESPDEPEAIASLRAQLPDLLNAQRAGAGVWIEDKRLSLVVHTRPADDPAAEQERLRAPLAELARRVGLELHTGRNVLEFRMSGYDKGTALRRLIDDVSPSAVLFCGDDIGDVPAFTALPALPIPAWGVLAASDETADLNTAADVIVDGPDGIVTMLQRIAAHHPSASS